uniref:separase n=1 Tax=Culex pipiens TaxID=7175 RepID=A0A8D8IHH0_CULPI
MSPIPRHNTALTRIALQREAAKALLEGRESDAIFYTTTSLCAGFHAKFDADCRRFSGSDNFVTTLLEDLNGNVPKDSDQFQPTKGFKDIRRQCADLPENWTVIQLSKAFTPRWNQLTHSQLLGERTAVDLVLFSFPNSELVARGPLLIRLEPPEDPEFFALASSIAVKIKSLLTDEINTSSMRQEEMETLIGRVISGIKSWLGPWIVLFCGKFCDPDDQQLEAEVFNRVEDFCITNKRSKRDQVLISLIARRLDMVDHASIYRFCCEIEDNAEQIRELYAFLVKLKDAKFEALPRFKCFPCLMIIDELLDGYPWEMMNLSQEFTRVASFQMLHSLFQAHKANIRNGYLHISVTNCHNIINPDKSLTKMSARLQTFYKEWYPHFKLIVDQPPTNAQFSSILHEADVMIYNGHGSGLQFIDGETILRHDIKSLVFLFGCDSVRLAANGLFSEMNGSHLYYNTAKCPTVVGALWVLTDFYTDYYSILLVGAWIPTENPKLQNHNVLELDPNAFKNGKLIFGSLLPQDSYDGNLLKLMAQFRWHKWLPKRITCAMVCRGLPVINAVESSK